MPVCWLRLISGIHCPTCGAFRCTCLLLSGRIPEAWLIQPMIVSLGFLGLAYFLYSYVVVFGRLPRLRIENVSQRTRRDVCFLLTGLFAANWVYLIVTG